MTLFIEIKNLNVGFDGVGILKNINLDINEGEVIGIIGKSGAGKSVLMRVLRGVEKITDISGNVIYHLAFCSKCRFVDVPSKSGTLCPKCNTVFEKIAADFARLPPDAPLRKDITGRTAIMLQRSFGLYGERSVIENLLYALQDIGETDQDALYRAEEVLEMIGLSHKKHSLAKRLSGGEKQRVILARQLLRNPILLLADEPTGTLDPNTAEEIHEMLLKTKEKLGMTLIMVSHWYKEILDHSQKTIWLEEGRIKKIGHPADIIASFMQEAGDVKSEVALRMAVFGLTAHETGKDAVSISRIPVVRIHNICKSYNFYYEGFVKAADDVSFEIYGGEIFGIIGASGSGKTTVSKIIAGLMEPTSGFVEVRIGDEWIDMRTPGPEGKGRATEHIGVLFQEYSLFPYRNIIHNLTRSLGMYKYDLNKVIRTLIIVGFTDNRAKEILEKMPDELSEGERLRVAMAQILMKDPKIVLLDEPVGTMDPITRLDVARSILNVRDKAGTTFIITSNTLDFISMVCDRVALMHRGRVVEVGETGSVLSLMRLKD